MRRLSLTVAIVLSVGLTAAAAEGSWMSEDELVSTFKGRGIDGKYEDGETFHERYAVDGSVAYRDSLRTSAGTWSVRAGTFCTIYQDDPSGGCYRVRRVSGNCFEFHFVARTEAEAAGRPRRPDWTARGWFPDKPTTCVDGESV